MNNVIAKLDAIHQDLLNLIMPIDEKQFSQRYSPDRWSIAENIHHLYLVETKYVEDFGKAIESKNTGMGPLRRLFQVPGWAAGIRLVRVRAPKIVEPLDAPPKMVVLNNYNRVRAALKEIAQKQGAEGLKNIALKHPFFGLLDGVNVVSFLGYHELRHHKQIAEMIKK